MVWKALASFLGTSETGVRLLTCLLLISPVLGILYRFFILTRKWPCVIRHWYFILTGLAMCFFCYGWHTGYILTSVFTVFVILRFCEAMNRPNLAPRLVFPFVMVVLLLGYMVYASEKYDINWTTVQCTLTLKMISIAFDWSDGQKDESKVEMKANLKQSFITVAPSLLEIMGYSFYFGGLHGGPVFQFRRYREFVEGSLFAHPIPSSFQPAAIQLFKGIMYLAQFIVMDFVFPDKYTYSSDLNGYPLIVQLLFNALWARKTLIRYIGVWLLADMSNILSGMAYNGKDAKSGKDKWDAVCGVHPILFETGCSCQSIIESFNITTNQWALNYIYKRLRFLNSKLISSAAVLLFLSIWHGFHPGYFLTFLGCELPLASLEKRVIETFKPHLPPWEHLGLPQKVIFCGIGMCWKHFALPYGLLPFVLLELRLSLQALARVYFLPHVFMLAWFLLTPIINRYLKTLPTYGEQKKTQ